MADAESRFTVDGLPMSKFRLSVSRFFSGQEQAAAADVIDIVAWKKVSEVAAQIAKKDQLILVEGRIQIRSFQNESGAKKWATEVVANNIQALSEKVVAEKTAVVSAPASEEVEDESILESGDLPF